MKLGLRTGKMVGMESTVIAQLQEIRVNLHSALRASEELENKIIGPRPCDPSSPKPSQECVASLLSDLLSLSDQLLRLGSKQHEVIGNFGPPAQPTHRLA